MNLMDVNNVNQNQIMNQMIVKVNHNKTPNRCENTKMIYNKTMLSFHSTISQ